MINESCCMLERLLCWRSVDVLIDLYAAENASSWRSTVDQPDVEQIP